MNKPMNRHPWTDSALPPVPRRRKRAAVGRAIASVTLFILAAAGAAPQAHAAPSAVPAISLTLRPTSVLAGQRVWATVTSPSTDAYTVTLSSDNPSLASVPDSITVPAGQQTGNFWVDTSPVTQTATVSISASSGGVTQSVTLTLMPPSIAGVALYAYSWVNGTSTAAGITGGGLGVGVVQINGNAGAKGALIPLTSNMPGVVPATAYVQPGNSGASFTFTTPVVTEEQTLIVKVVGSNDPDHSEGGIQVMPFGLQTISVLPSRVHPGDKTDGIIILNGPAPDRGAPVLISNPNGNVWPPQFRVTVPAGSTAIPFSVQVLPSVTPDWGALELVAEYGGLQKKTTLKLLATPHAPTTLVATVVPATSVPAQVKLTWADNSNNEDAFVVWRKTSTQDWTRIGVLPPQSTSFTDATVSANVGYTYRVRATCDTFASAWSNEATANLPTAPAAPTGLAVQTTASHAIQINWTAVSVNAKAFAIWRKSGTSDWQRVGVVAPNVRSFTDRGLTPSTSYTYRVRATNDHFASDWSNEVSVTTSP